MTDLKFTRELREGDILALRIQLASSADIHGLKAAGEAEAVRMLGRAEKIWVFVWGHDMDIEGPAACMSYMDGESTGPCTEFSDPIALTHWYMQQHLREID